MIGRLATVKFHCFYRCLLLFPGSAEVGPGNRPHTFHNECGSHRRNHRLPYPEQFHPDKVSHRTGIFVFHIKNQPEQKVINIRQFAEQITAALFRYFQIGYFFHPLFRLFKRKIIHRLQQGCQYLKLADILFPQSGCQIRTRFVPGGYLLYFGQRDTEVQLIVDTLFAHAGGYDTVHCHAQLGTYFF